MIRELHCPSCGKDARPTLMPAPLLYTCPGCGDTYGREKLVTVKSSFRHIAGTGPSGIVANVVGSGTFYDAAGGTSQLVISNCNFNSGDTAVVCFAYNAVGAGGATALVAAITGNSSTSIGVETGTADQGANISYRANIVGGVRTVTIGSLTGITAAAAIVLAIPRLKLTSPQDQFAGGNATSASFDTTATAALTAIDFAVACVGSQAANTVAKPTWNQSFIHLVSAGTNGGGAAQETRIDVAVRQLSSLSAIQVTGTLPASTQHADCVGTFKLA